MALVVVKSPFFVAGLGVLPVSAAPTELDESLARLMVQAGKATWLAQSPDEGGLAPVMYERRPDGLMTDGNPTGYVRKQFVTGRCQVLGHKGTAPIGLSANTIDRLGSRVMVAMGRRNARNLRLVFTPHYLDPEYKVAPNAFTVAAGVERNSLYAGAKFAGATSRVIQPTDGLIESDVVLPAASGMEVLALRTEVTMTVGQRVPVGYLRYPSNNTVETMPQSTAQASQLEGIGVMPIGGNYVHAGFGFGPIAVVGEVDEYQRSVLLWSDSTGDGNGYHTAADDGEMGFMAKACYLAGLPHCKATRGSNRAMYMTPALAPLQHSLCRYATDLWEGLGTNDVFYGRTLAEIKADLLAIWTGAKAVNPAIRIWRSPILPRTTSTDAWATEANQTPLSGFEAGGIRDQLNAWFYDQVGAGVLAGVINHLPQAESSSVHGIWGAGKAADGTHQTTAVIDAQATAASLFLSGWAFGN